MVSLEEQINAIRNEEQAQVRAEAWVVDDLHMVDNAEALKLSN